MNTTINEKINSDEILKNIKENFPEDKIYAVGGVVRDFVMDNILGCAEK